MDSPVSAGQGGKLGAGRPVSVGSESETVYGIRQKQTILTNAQIQELVSAYRAGKTVYELAEQFGCHRTTVSEHLKASGVRMRMQPLSGHMVDELVHLYESGLSCAKIGKIIGVDDKTVWNHLKRREVGMRGAHERQAGGDRFGLPR